MIREARLYVFRGAEGCHKVGVSKSPAERAKIVGGDVVWVSDVVYCAGESESIAHKMLWSAGKQIKGEWFSADAEECIRVAKTAICVAHGEADWPEQSNINGCAKRGFRRRVGPKAVTFHAEQEDLDAIEELRKAMSPIPSVTDVVKQAIREMRDRERKRSRK